VGWWHQFPGEIYWIEQTDRPDLGGPLKAPANSSNAGQQILQLVNEGDVVLHWYKPQEAIVGYSQVRGTFTRGKMNWPRESPVEIDAYIVPLGGIEILENPITLLDLRNVQQEIKHVMNDLKRDFGSPFIYLSITLKLWILSQGREDI
jgi:hypothetical protein